MCSLQKSSWSTAKSVGDKVCAKMGRTRGYRVWFGSLFEKVAKGTRRVCSPLSLPYKEIVGCYFTVWEQMHICVPPSYGFLLSPENNTSLWQHKHTGLKKHESFPEMLESLLTQTSCHDHGHEYWSSWARCGMAPPSGAKSATIEPTPWFQHAVIQGSRNATLSQHILIFRIWQLRYFFFHHFFADRALDMINIIIIKVHILNTRVFNTYICNYYTNMGPDHKILFQVINNHYSKGNHC